MASAPGARRACARLWGRFPRYRGAATPISRLRFRAGFTYPVAGQTEQQRSAFGSLGLALMLVYMIMASQFQSLVDPFVIVFTVPLGVLGVIWMLLLTHPTLSIISSMGSSP